MSNTASAPPQSAHHTAMRPGSPPTVKHPDTRRRLQWLTITPGAATIVVAAATITYILTTSATLTPTALAVILALAGLICLGVLVTSSALVAGINRARQEQIEALRSAVINDAVGLPELIQQRQLGDTAHPYGSAVNAPSSLGSLAFAGGEFADLARDLAALRRTALESVTPSQQPAPPEQAVAAPAPRAVEPPPPAVVEQPERRAATPIVLDEHAFTDHRVSVFVNLARRLQSLVHREIKLLDELEAQVEDPDLLKGLFSVDHLATRIRRHAENLAVLGGAVSRRQWSRPVNLYEVLRSAVAEVEHYSRVKLVRPIEGTVRGHAVADVIHLIAELVENATVFSAPATQVLLRAQQVTAGLAIDVEDRGLGMPAEEQSRINMMLASPDDVDIDELLRDGRIGLFVVASLARRHKVAVQLRTNIYGGTQAVVVLPHNILGDVGGPRADGNTSSQPAVTTPKPVQQLTAAQAQVPQPEPVTESPRPVAVDDTVSIPLQKHEPAATRAAAPPPVDAPPQTWPARTDHQTPAPALSAADIPPGSFDGFATHTPGRDSEPLQGYPTHQGIGSPRVEEAPRAWGATPPSSSVDDGSSASVLNDGKPRFDEYWSDGTVEDANPSTGRRDGRPELPKRRQQSHLAPQLREAPRTDPGTDHEGHDPGLMSAFQRGAARSEENS